MKKLLIILTSFVCLTAHSQSSLEGEFLKQSNIRMPVVYTAISGLSFDFSIQKDELDEAEDDLFGDITGLSVNAGPIAYGSLERVKRQVSEEVSERQDLVIEEATPGSPYLLIESRKWDLAGL